MWKSSSASGAPDNSSLSHFSAMTRPCWLLRAGVASMAWRGRFITARRSEELSGAPVALVDFHTGHLHQGQAVADGPVHRGRLRQGPRDHAVALLHVPLLGGHRRAARAARARAERGVLRTYFSTVTERYYPPGLPRHPPPPPVVVTVLEIVGGAPRGGTPRVADSSAAGAGRPRHVASV